MVVLLRKSMVINSKFSGIWLGVPGALFRKRMTPFPRTPLAPSLGRLVGAPSGWRPVIELFGDELLQKTLIDNYMDTSLRGYNSVYDAACKTTRIQAKYG